MLSYTHHTKHICCYCSQAFCTGEILKSHVNDCIKVNGKQMIKMPKNGEYVRSRNCEIKIKSLFIIYEDFERILVPEDNGKQNPKSLHKQVLQTCCVQ